MAEQTKKWIVRSQSTLNTFYTVAQDSAGVFSCTCPDFQYRRNRCKHIVRIKMRIAGTKQENKLPGAEQ